MLNAYIIQEFSQLDGQWHNVCLSSSNNGIYTDEKQARTIYDLFKDANTNPNHLRLITCKLAIVKAECGNYAVDFMRNRSNEYVY